MKSTPDSQSKAQAAVGELLNLLTTLATGALVFSVGFEGVAASTFPAWLKGILVLAWIALLAAVILGVGAQSFIIVQTQENKPNIDAPDLRGWTQWMELAFLLGLFCLGLTLSLEIFFPNNLESPRIRTASGAISALKGHVCGEISKITTVELIKGEDPNAPLQDVWHVAVAEKMVKGKTATSEDFFINADGSIISPTRAASCGR